MSSHARTARPSTLFADRDLAARIESAGGLARLGYLASLRRLYDDVRTADRAVAGGVATYTDSDPHHSRASGLGLAEPLEASVLDAVEEFYRDHGCDVAIDVVPHVGDSALALLADRGYVVERVLNVLAVPLDDPRESMKSTRFDVELVTSDAIELWVGSAMRGFEVADADKPWFARLLHAYAARPGTFCFLARVGEDVAGAAALSIIDGIGTLHATSTVTKHRRRGAHRAMLDARLSFAASARCDIAVVETRPGDRSQRNVERAGFRVLYTRPTLVRRRAAADGEVTA